MLVDSHPSLESMVSDLRSHSHQRVLEHGLSMDFFCFFVPNLLFFFLAETLDLQSLVELFVRCKWSSFQDSVSDSIRSSVKSLLSPFNLIDNWGFNVEVGGSFAAIDCIEGLNQETNKQIHISIFFDHQVNSPCWENQSQALPWEEWERCFDSWSLVVKLHDVII